MTFTGGLLALGGSAYTGNGTVTWEFNVPPLPLWNGSGNPIQWSTGPTAGETVWQEIYFNVTQGSSYELAIDRVVLWNGVVAAENWTYVPLVVAPPSEPVLDLLVNPSVGPAPLFFNVTAWVNGTLNPNASYGLDVEASKAGLVGWDTSMSWSGARVTFPGDLNQSGIYYLLATLVELIDGEWQNVTSANASLDVGTAGAIAPPSVSFSASAGERERPTERDTEPGCDRREPPLLALGLHGGSVLDGERLRHLHLCRVQVGLERISALDADDALDGGQLHDLRHRQR